jgi:MoxR-like ATPase
VVAIETAHMLPEADVAFLDEVFLGSTAILNTLLAILNERRFRRGHTDLRCPLRTCVGASNALPEDPSLAAFADRFLLRCFVSRTMDPMLEDLLEAGWGVSKKETEEAAGDQGLEAVAALSAQLSEVELGGIRQPLSAMFRKLRGAGIVLSDRRMVRSQRLIAAAALLDGRTVADGRDLWPIYYVLPTEENQTGAREILGASLKDSRNRALSAAALEASSGPKARADRLLAQAQELFSQPESPERALKLEGLARELDAGFAAPLPPDLGALRTRLQSVLVI